jgi:hypothetical protein
MSADTLSIKNERAYDHRSYFGNDYTIKDIQSIFDANGLECNYAEKRAALIRASNLHIDSWFGWKSTSINMNHNLTQHKFMLIRHSSALFGKNTVKRSHQLVED